MKQFLITCLLVFLTISGWAQRITATVSKNRVSVSETFQIQFFIDGTPTGFQGPSFTDFDVLSGPNSSQSVQIINGTMSQSTSYSYYLRPKKEGKFTIGPGTINSGGKKIESNSVTITVIAEGAPASGQQNQKDPAAQAAGNNLFIKSSLSKSKVWQGEQVTITHKVYTRINLVGFQGAKMPSYTGFWSQEIPNQTNYAISKETLNGVQYSVVEFKKTFLFPQRSGTLEIDPIGIDCVVRQQNHRQDPWNLFSIGAEDVLYKLKGQSLKIEVMPLPEGGKPASFTGAVGQFSMKAQANKDHVKTNEAVNVTVSVSGRGNINLVDPPKLSIPPDIESYDPKSTESINCKPAGVEGTKTSEYVLIPRHHGNYTIGSAEFSYFDPEKKAYFSLHTPDFSFAVEKAADENGTTSSMAPLGNRNEVALIGNDIRYIRTGPILLVPKDFHFYGSRGFILGFVLPLLAFIIFLVLRIKHKKDNSDLLLVKSKKATKMAKGRLSLALKHLEAGNKQNFYMEISSAFYGYLGDRLHMQLSELSRETITTCLTRRQVSAENIAELESIISACEFARYAPSAASGDLRSIYNQSVGLLTKLENDISRKPNT